MWFYALVRVDEMAAGLPRIYLWVWMWALALMFLVEGGKILVSLSVVWANPGRGENGGMIRYA